MKKLAWCGVLAVALIPAAPAVGARHKHRPKPMKTCKTLNLAPMVVAIHKRGPSCADTRIVIRSVESHAVQCAPYRQQTIAPFRECTVTPVLSVGTRNFSCRSAYEARGSNKRFWKTTCKTGYKDVVRYRRDAHAGP